MVLVSLELGECVVSWTATREIHEAGIHTRSDRFRVRRRFRMGVSGWSRIRTVGVGVLFYQLSLNVEDMLAKDSKIIKGVSGVAIHGDMSSDIAWEPTFEMHVSPVLMDAIFTELTERCLELSVVLHDSIVINATS